MSELNWLDKYIVEQQASHMRSGITPAMFAQFTADLEKLEWLEEEDRQKRIAQGEDD